MQTHLRTHGLAADPINGHRFVTFGDDCPGDACTDGIAVHEARIAMIDEGGDVVLPQFYALCCACHQKQFIQKDGIENVQPCGCDDVSLAAIAIAQRRQLAARSAVVEAELAIYREQLVKQLAAVEAGEEAPRPSNYGVLKVSEEELAKLLGDAEQQKAIAASGTITQIA